MEIRTVVALLVDSFDFSFAPGHSTERLQNETLDCFAAIPGPLDLVFRKTSPEALVYEEDAD